jgi:16S rRNA (uracil1498-N3)-methyltransferase
MARRLFFVPEVRSGLAELRGEDAKHLSRVLRVEPGHRYEISDNEQKYLAEVVEAHKECVKFEVVEKLAAEREKPEIHLYVAIIKFEHFEWGIEKATELGVDRIVPVQSARTETGLDKAVAKRLERWRKIALEASQQSRRVFLPRLDGVARLKDVLKVLEGQRIFLDENRDAGLLGGIEVNGDVVSLLIGPEGGWTDEERRMVVEAGWTPASLGPRILRAETAWLAAMAILRR